MNSKQRKTLELIFKNPVPNDIRWTDIETMLKGFGAEFQKVQVLEYE